MITITLSLVVFLNLLLSFLSITQDRKSWINRFFSLLSFSAAIWTFTNLMTGIYPTSFWLKSTYSFGALVMSTGLAWTFLLTDKVFKIKKIAILYLFALFFFIASFFDGFIAKSYEAIYPGGAFEGEPGIGLIPYSIFFFFIAIMIIYNLISGHRKAINKDEKTKLRYILYGSIGALSVSFLTSFVFPIFEIYQFSGLDSIGFLIFLLTISYAVIKYRLLDIKTIVTELLVFAIWIFLLIRTVFTVQSKNWQDFLLDGGLLILLIIVGTLLIRSVWKEVRQREKLEIMTEKIKRAYKIEKKALEIEKKAHKELKRLDDAKNQFLMATQHHLRTPLTSMQGYLDLMFGGTYGKVPEKIKVTLEKLKVSTDRLIKIVNELLDLSQFQLGKRVISPKPNIRIEPLLKEIVEELKFEAENKHIYLTFKKSKKAPPTANIDAGKIKVALYNIVDNGIKYTYKGGVTIMARSSDHKLLIEVSDTGIGFIAEELKGLFSKTFERGEEAKKVFSTGKGIGLYIAHKIIDAHKGKVWVESKGKGKGSTFYVELPVS